MTSISWLRIKTGLALQPWKIRLFHASYLENWNVLVADGFELKGVHLPMFNFLHHTAGRREVTKKRLSQSCASQTWVQFNLGAVLHLQLHSNKPQIACIHYTDKLRRSGKPGEGEGGTGSSSEPCGFQQLCQVILPFNDRTWILI